MCVLALQWWALTYMLIYGTTRKDYGNDRTSPTCIEYSSTVASTGHDDVTTLRTAVLSQVRVMVTSLHCVQQYGRKYGSWWRHYIEYSSSVDSTGHCDVIAFNIAVLRVEQSTVQNYIRNSTLTQVAFSVRSWVRLVS